MPRARLCAPRALAALVAVLSLGLAGMAAAAPGSPSAVSSMADGGTVVVLSPGADAAKVAQRLGLKPTRVFTHALDAFVVPGLSPAQRQDAVSDPAVVQLAPDKVMVADRAPAGWTTDTKPPDVTGRQLVPTGVRLTGADRHPVADIDGFDERVDVDVAVLDDGVDPTHPDLNVTRTINCLGKRYVADDHGTHVAGTIGALDNDFGVVGMAPGARIWGIRMFDRQGATTLSSVICAVEAAVANSDIIDVVNMSAGFPGVDEGRCGTFDPSNDPVQTAICALEDEDVPFIASAGNESQDAATQVPAAYDASFTVSAFTDYDGRLGGMGQPLCWPDIGLPDDHIAWFSNFGEDVDIAAPGVCILSTTSGSEAQQYDYNLGTSMAAPHVAGAAALYLASNPGASNAALRRALLRAAVPGPLPGDPDAYPEPLLNVTELP